MFKKLKTWYCFCRRRFNKTVLYLIIFVLFIIIAFNVSDFHTTNFQFISNNQPRSFSGPNVFLMETNKTKRYLFEMNACSAESAAKHHPDSQIIYFKHGDSFLENGSLLMSLLENYPNIRFAYLDANTLFDETPLYDFDTMDKISKSSFPEDHLSDIGRAALLWKYGGIYIDTDVIVLRSMANLRNAIGTEKVNATRVNTAVMMFDKHFKFFYNYMIALKFTYWHAFFYRRRLGPGPDLISYLLQAACSGTKYDPLPVNNTEACHGINVLPYEILNPISYNTSWKIFFLPKLVTLDLSNSHTVHLSHSLIRDLSTPVGSGSYLDLLFKENCPVTYRQIHHRIYT